MDNFEAPWVGKTPEEYYRSIISPYSTDNDYDYEEDDYDYEYEEGDSANDLPL